MREMLVGKAALTVVRHNDGSRSNVAAGKPVPASVDPQDAARLYEEGFLEIVELPDEPEDVEAPAEEVAADDFPADSFPDLERPADWDDMSDDEKLEWIDDNTEEVEEREPLTAEEIAALRDGSNADVLGKVDGDPVVAAQVLEVEQADAKPRPQLVKALEELVAADAEDGGDQ